jgi:hypothetical protein
VTRCSSSSCRVMDETLRLSESLQKSSPRRSTPRHRQGGRRHGGAALGGMATSGEVTVDMTGTKIMGVSVPVVTKGESPIRSSFTRGYSVTGVSSRVDETAEKFERSSTSSSSTRTSRRASSVSVRRSRRRTGA